MLFLEISNTDMWFGKKTPTDKSYNTNKTLFISKQVQIVNLKEFVIATLDVSSKTFVMHVAIWEQKKLLLHSKRLAQV